ncbi:MAG: hypothetical protein Q8O14_00915 [bacterium]|nr:hypothetical protein [bacterium]
MRDRMPTPGPCACGNTDIRHHIQSTIKGAEHEATELRWCPKCGHATATIGRADETYRQLRERADGEWAAASPPQLDAISPRARRVLAAICLLGPKHSTTQNLVLATSLAPSQVLPAMDTLKEKGIIVSTQDATWWPTHDWQSVLDLAMSMAEVSIALDTLPLRPLSAIPQPEGATA